MRDEFDHCNQQLKEAKRAIEVLEKQKIDTAKNHEVEIANKDEEIAVIKSSIDVKEVSLPAYLNLSVKSF